jgi:glycosyltransferase involved in cell wall biosynthesis
VRILVSLRRPGPYGGIEKSMTELAGALTERGHRFILAYEEPDPSLSDWEELGADLVRVPPCSAAVQHPVRGTASTVVAIRRVAPTSPDLVYSHLRPHLPFAVGVARRLRVPLVTHVREVLPPRPRFFPLYRAMFRQASEIIFLSDAQRSDYLNAGLVGPGASVVYTGVNPDVYRPPTRQERSSARRTLKLDDDDFVLLFLGRLERSKGIETLFGAFRRLPSPRPRLLIAGGPTYAMEGAGRAYAARLEVAVPEGVDLLGRQRDVIPLLWAADVVVMPSVWREPLGRVPLEAMACGVPVVASRTGGVPEIFRGDLEQFLVEPGDPVSLAAAISRLTQGLARNQVLKEQLRSYVSSQFRLEDKAGEVEAVLEAALSTQGGTRGK